MAADLAAVVDSFKNNRLEFNHGLDISEFRYDVIAQKVNALLR